MRDQKLKFGRKEAVLKKEVVVWCKTMWGLGFFVFFGGKMTNK